LKKQDQFITLMQDQCNYGMVGNCLKNFLWKE
jgi:hypothetical protein